MGKVLKQHLVYFLKIFFDYLLIHYVGARQFKFRQLKFLKKFKGFQLNSKTFLKKIKNMYIGIIYTYIQLILFENF